MYFYNHFNKNPDFLNKYLKFMLYINQYSETTVNELYSDIRTFLRYLIFKDNKEYNSDFKLSVYKKISIKELTIEDMDNVKPYVINDYIFFTRNYLDNSPRTRNRKLASLKNFFNYLENNKYISNDPTKNIPFAQIGKRNPKHLSLDESKKMLSKAIKSNARNKIRNYAIICLFLNCCLRLSELANIDINNIKFDEKTLKVTGKGDRDRIVYLNKAVIQALKKYLKIREQPPKDDEAYYALFLSERKKRLSKRSIQDIIDKEFEKLLGENKTGFHTHSLRHTGATLLYNEADTSILILKKILGHKLLSSTEIYTSVSNKKLKEIMENYSISSLLEKKEDKNNGRK